MDEEHRRRIGRGVRRAWQTKRERAGGRPAHVDAWIQEGRVAPELVPILKERRQQAEAMVHELGGPEAVTARQKALVDAWMQAQVAADVQFARLARGDVDSSAERHARLLNSARAALAELRLPRQTKGVSDPGFEDGLDLEGVGRTDARPSRSTSASAASSRRPSILWPSTWKKCSRACSLPGVAPTGGRAAASTSPSTSACGTSSRRLRGAWLSAWRTWSPRAMPSARSATDTQKLDPGPAFAHPATGPG